MSTIVICITFYRLKKGSSFNRMKTKIPMKTFTPVLFFHAQSAANSFVNAQLKTTDLHCGRK